MLEEKSVKHWLKRKVKVTEALLVAFLITGGIASAEETVSKAEFDALKTKVEALEKNGTNYVTILSTSEENKVAPSEGRDVVNIGTNQVGEKNKEQHYVTVVGTSNKIKNFRITPDDVKPDSIEESHAYGETVFGNGNTVADGVIIGRKNIATGSSGVVLGENSENYGDRSINIGYLTETYGTDSIAMGFSSKALGTSALALGGYAEAKTVGAIAIGDSAIAEKGVALGYNSLADRSGGEVGYYPEFGTTEREAIAKKLGKEAEYKETMKVFETSKELIEKEREYYSVIAKRNEYQKQLNEQTVDLINYNKDAQKYKDAVAKILEIKTQYKENEKKELELGKIVSTDNPEYKKLNDARSTYGNIFGAYSSTMSAVSVGNEKEGIYRQITGVAAGSKDTDAVNVAQLKSLNTKVDKGASHYYSANDMNHHVDNFNNDGAKGLFSTVAGPGSTIKQTNNQMFQGATSSILGSFNTIDAGDKEFDGVANSIVGVANTTKDANGSLIFGAGNKITNSYRGVDFTKLNGNGLNLSNSQSVAEALGKAVANSGGSVLAIGGANTADYATLSKVIGVGNTLKGSAQNESTLNMIDGFKNTGTNIKNTTIVGSENTVENGSSNVVIGDKHKLTQVSNSVILGSTDQETETTVSDVVSIGHNAKVEKEGGIALGSSSVANREKGQAGFDISTNLVSTDKSAIWKATHSAVSIGDFKKGYTRQITGVAAGSEDTDAVNVAQLKKVKDSINTAVENSKIHYYSVNSNKVGDDSNYKNNGATGDDAIAIGIGVKAKGQHAIAMGNNVESSGYASIAMGNNVESSGYASIAIGKDSEATKQGAIAIGMGAKVYAGGGVAIGTNVQAGDSPSDGDWSPVALGYGTKSLGGASTAFGYESVARGAHSIAGGDRSKATGQDSVALGQEVEASGTWSVALGQKTVASASNSMAMGENTKASGSNSTAMGIKTEASGAGSTTMGYGTKAIGDWSLATGAYSKSEGEFSTAMGLSSVAKGHNSFAVSGANVEKDASNAIAMGYNATAKLTDSVALGSGSVASTKQGVAGYNPITDKNYERTPEAAAAYQKWIDAYNAWEAIDEAEKDKKAEKLKECNAMKEEYNKLVSTWESTKSAIAVGDKEKGISRQITGVAAGREDTDAVNVAQLKSLNTKVDKGATHYYSVNDIDDHVDNYKNDGAKGVYSTVAGPGSTIKQTNNQMFQGATSAILGSFNTIDAGDKEFDGVANSIVGVANTTKDANGSLIFGAGNKITNSYRGVDFTKLKGNGLNLSDSQSVAEALGKLVANSGGSVLAIGGANTADYATLSKVIGVGNTLKGSAQNESTLNMIDGFKNTGTNIKNTTIVGSENTVENGSSNILIGDKHKLKKVSNSVILGSTEQETETTVSDVVSIGHNAKVEKKGGIALGSSSVANREKGQAGFDISTNLASTEKSATWKATHSALSIGDGNTVTRQITGVAAGRADTDAVNVAQLKSVLSHPFHVFSRGEDISKGRNFTFYQMNWEFTDGLKATVQGEGENRKVVVSLDKENLKNDPDFKGPKGDKGDTGEVGPKGDKGDTGEVGPKGEPGKDGKDGKNGEGAKVLAGNNIKVDSKEKKQGEDKVIENTISLKEDIKVKTVSADSINVGDVNISKSGINAGKQKITNVADGKADSDAANMKQLRKVEENAKKDAEKLGNAINHNAQKIHDLKKEVGNVGALSSAMAALNPMEYDPMKPNQVLAGVGSYKNSQAVAVGMSHHFNENLRVQAGVSVSEGRKTESMVNLGLAWKIGKDDRDDSYNKYKEGPISSIYVMQDEMKQVMEENKNLKSEVEEMKKQLQTLIKQK